MRAFTVVSLLCFGKFTNFREGSKGIHRKRTKAEENNHNILHENCREKSVLLVSGKSSKAQMTVLQQNLYII